MFVKLYWTMWAMLLFAAAMFFLLGSMTMPTVVVFGFLCAGLVFMGMMCVLPSRVANANRGGSTRPPGLMQTLRSLAHALFYLDGVEMAKPKFGTGKHTILHH